MAKYKASPYYMVGDIKFDMNGEYATEKADEIEALDALAPVWVRKLDGEKKTEEPKPASKPRKASVK